MTQLYVYKTRGVSVCFYTYETLIICYLQLVKLSDV